MPGSEDVVRNVNGYVAPALTVDAVLLKGRDVMLVRRGNDPFKGEWALPGGFVEVGETVERACLRELVEETSMQGAIVDLLGVYSDPDRDPRGHTISVTFVCRVRGIVPPVASDAPSARPRSGQGPLAGDDAAEAAWHPVDDLPDLAFDHARIIEDARKWLAAAGNFERLADNDTGLCA